MATKTEKDLNLDEILKILESDSVVRAGVIRALARDFPSDFLSPVKLNFDLIASGGTASDKEWQE